jgi:homoserine kinase type II
VPTIIDFAAVVLRKCANAFWQFALVQVIMTNVEAILRKYPADCTPSRVESLGNAGGMSGARFWRLATPRGTLVLRRWPKEHPTLTRLSFIHSVLAHAARNGIGFLAVPIATRHGDTFVVHDEALFELAPWLTGDADYERSPSATKLAAAMSALAQFHVATADFQSGETPASASRIEPAPAVSGRLARLRELGSGGIEELSRAIDRSTWPELVPLARQFIAALPQAVPPAIAKLEPLSNVPLPLQPCIRDIWHDHVLFRGERVAGLIDFGALDIDTPAADIARLLGSLADCTLHDGEGHAAFDIWQEGLNAYTAIRPLSENESLAVTALDAAAPILAGCNWILWIYLDRRQFENRAQIYERFRKIAACVS